MYLYTMSTPSTTTCYVERMNVDDLPAPSFGEWLDDELKVRGWSRPKLAREIDVSVSTVTSWIVGVRTPKESTCRNIAAAFGIEPNEVLSRAGRPLDGTATATQAQIASANATLRNGVASGGTEDPLTDSHSLTQNVSEHLSRIEREVARIAAGLRWAGLMPGPSLELADDPVTVSVIGRVPADALRWTAGMEDYGDVEVTRAEVGNARAPFALIATGDCWRSIGLMSDDIVLCDRALGREPRDRQIVVVRINEEVTLKRWCITGDGVELRDGNEEVAYRIRPGDEVEVIGFYLTFRPVAER